MDRIDPYTTVHKGLRRALFETAVTVGRTDFERGQETERCVADVRRLLAFLGEHAEHEDDVLMPELRALSPALHVALREDHARTDGLHRELEGLLVRLEGAGGAERVALGRRLALRTAALVAEHLRHLEREEVEANRILWAHRSDAELRALEDRIVGSIPAERLGDWFALMLPAMTGAERRELLHGLREALPADAFLAVTGPARELLGERAWSEALLAPAI